jgi:hypothetical protein
LAPRLVKGKPISVFIVIIEVVSKALDNFRL